MKHRANSFKNIAASFYREIENLINSATPPFSVPPVRQASEIEFMKKLHPKISEFRKVYLAPEIRRKVMEKWGPRANLGIDLSRIRSTVAAEVYGIKEEDTEGIIDFNKASEERSERLNEEGQFGDWEPIRALKTRIREFEKKILRLKFLLGLRIMSLWRKLSLV
ncbi:digalactosyldiacylglycerol synthase 1, chloroplastic-like isoform X2 [Hibiscus syriacus]|nr:digalactosyldiacylglycerol synthase 1, chloroplastic-like isoform X2 [Hibiscus syriacus]